MPKALARHPEAEISHLPALNPSKTLVLVAGKLSAARYGLRPAALAMYAVFYKYALVLTQNVVNESPVNPKP